METEKVKNEIYQTSKDISRLKPIVISLSRKHTMSKKQTDSIVAHRKIETDLAIQVCEEGHATLEQILKGLKETKDCFDVYIEWIDENTKDLTWSDPKYAIEKYTEALLKFIEYCYSFQFKHTDPEIILDFLRERINELMLILPWLNEKKQLVETGAPKWSLAHIAQLRNPATELNELYVFMGQSLKLISDKVNGEEQMKHNEEKTELRTGICKIAQLKVNYAEAAQLAVPLYIYLYINEAKKWEETLHALSSTSSTPIPRKVALIINKFKEKIGNGQEIEQEIKQHLIQDTLNLYTKLKKMKIFLARYYKIVKINGNTDLSILHFVDKNLSNMFRLFNKAEQLITCHENDPSETTGVLIQWVTIINQFAFDEIYQTLNEGEIIDSIPDLNLKCRLKTIIGKLNTLSYIASLNNRHNHHKAFSALHRRLQKNQKLSYTTNMAPLLKVILERIATEKITSKLHFSGQLTALEIKAITPIAQAELEDLLSEKKSTLSQEEINKETKKHTGTLVLLQHYQKMMIKTITAGSFAEDHSNQTLQYTKPLSQHINALNIILRQMLHDQNKQSLTADQSELYNRYITDRFKTILNLLPKLDKQNNWQDCEESQPCSSLAKKKDSETIDTSFVKSLYEFLLGELQVIKQYHQENSSLDGGSNGEDSQESPQQDMRIFEIIICAIEAAAQSAQEQIAKLEEKEQTEKTKREKNKRKKIKQKQKNAEAKQKELAAKAEAEKLATRAKQNELAAKAEAEKLATRAKQKELAAKVQEKKLAAEAKKFAAKTEQKELTAKAKAKAKAGKLSAEAEKLASGAKQAETNSKQASATATLVDIHASVSARLAYTIPNQHVSKAKNIAKDSSAEAALVALNAAHSAAFFSEKANRLVDKEVKIRSIVLGLLNHNKSDKAIDQTLITRLFDGQLPHAEPGASTETITICATISENYLEKIIKNYKTKSGVTIDGTKTTINLEQKAPENHMLTVQFTHNSTNIQINIQLTKHEGNEHKSKKLMSQIEKSLRDSIKELTSLMLAAKQTENGADEISSEYLAKVLKTQNYQQSEIKHLNDQLRKSGIGFFNAGQRLAPQPPTVTANPVKK